MESCIRLETGDRGVKSFAHLQRAEDAGNLARSGMNKWALEGVVNDLDLLATTYAYVNELRMCLHPIEVVVFLTANKVVTQIVHLSL